MRIYPEKPRASIRKMAISGCWLKISAIIGIYLYICFGFLLMNACKISTNLIINSIESDFGRTV
jgi:hypothetical protein